MIVTKREKTELITISSATFVVSSTNLALTSSYIVGDIVGSIVNESFKGAKYAGEKLAERFIKKNNINSDWD